MPLNIVQIANLNAAIEGYGFPAVYFDFVTNAQVTAANMTAVEIYINTQLTSANPQDVLHGLANILYWGYAQIGYRNVRVDTFLATANIAHAVAFQDLVLRCAVPTLRQIHDLRMPQFSGISFISKILAFLNPVEYCVLDNQLACLANVHGLRSLDTLRTGRQIRVTVNNQLAYDGWRAECLTISNTYYNGTYRVVDIERGFFHLVQTNQLPLAQVIYANS